MLNMLGLGINISSVFNQQLCQTVGERIGAEEWEGQ